MIMVNYFQNFWLQSTRNDDSPIIHQETFRHGEIRTNRIPTMEITWDIARFCRPTINCKFHRFPYHQVFVSRFSDLVKTNIRYWPRTRNFTNVHFNFFNCSFIFFVTSWQGMSREGISTNQLFPGLYLIVLINNRGHLIGTALRLDPLINGTRGYDRWTTWTVVDLGGICQISHTPKQRLNTPFQSVHTDSQQVRVYAMQKQLVLTDCSLPAR